MPVTLAISADKGTPKSKLDQLAEQTSLPLLSPKIKPEYLLHICTDRLECRRVISSSNQKKQKFEAISVDFLGGKANHRRLHGGGKGQDIAKAIGLHKIKNPTILDLTAGMGGDSFVLATLGAEVTMIERNPIVHALLKDALDRVSLSADADIQDIFRRIKLKNIDSQQALTHLNEETFPDVIYLDPMFPARTKSAQVKKEMQFFHDIVGDDEDSESLLLNAMAKAKKRIVVKRPRLAEALTDKFQANFVVSGKSTRYDIYLPKE